MRPIVAMWCAICSQKSFLFTSQNISEGIACSGNRAGLSRHAAAHSAGSLSVKFTKTSTRESVAVWGNSKEGFITCCCLVYLLNSEACRRGFQLGHALPVGFADAAVSPYVGVSPPEHSSPAPEHTATATPATPHSCREGIPCSPARNTSCL